MPPGDMKMMNRGIAKLMAMLVALMAVACGGGDEQPQQAAIDGVGLFCDNAAVSVEDIRRQMKVGSEPMQRRTLTQDELYRPGARISLDVVAGGGLTLADLAKEANARTGKANGEPYAACLIMAGLPDVIAATDAEASLGAILGDYEALLDGLATKEIPTVVCEILPVVAAYEKPSYGMPATAINGLIGELNKSLYALALDKAAGFIFAERVLGPRVGLGAGSILINEANSDNKNGVQPTIEGLRLLCQLYAYGLHKAGYRGGRILVLGDTRVSDEALTRRTDNVEFLLPKYLEIELNKTCP